MNALWLAIKFIIIGILLTIYVSNIICLKAVIWALIICVIILAVYIEIKEKN